MEIELIPDREYEEKKYLAKKIIQQVIRNITDAIPSFCYAYERFGYNPQNSPICICTDGRNLIYNPKYVVNTFRKRDIRQLQKELLHVLLHVLAGHIAMFRQSTHRELMSVIMDREVAEAMTVLMGSDDYHYRNPSGLELFQQTVSQYFGCKYGKAKKNLSNPYYVDSHDFWLASEPLSDEELSNMRESALGKEVHIGLKSETGNTLKDMLEECGLVRIKTSAGDVPGNTGVGYSPRKSKTDYRDAIRELTQDIITETESPELIDRIMYTYGLSLYGNIALVEPGEDETELINKVLRLVIAIDVSGSCEGEKCEMFLGEIGRLLGNIQAFTEEDSEIILIQCDSVIQEEKKYTPEELRRIDLSGTTLHGFGGTSFIPVFERVDQMNRNENKNVNGLIYFSDGYGIYPDNAPDYPVLFVLPDDDCYGPGPSVPKYVNVSYFRQ